MLPPVLLNSVSFVIKGKSAVSVIEELTAICDFYISRNVIMTFRLNVIA